MKPDLGDSKKAKLVYTYKRMQWLSMTASKMLAPWLAINLCVALNVDNCLQLLTVKGYKISQTSNWGEGEAEWGDLPFGWRFIFSCRNHTVWRVHTKKNQRVNTKQGFSSRLFSQYFQLSTISHGLCFGSFKHTAQSPNDFN